MSRWTAAGDGVGEDRGPPTPTTEALRGFLGVSGRCGCIVKEFSMPESRTRDTFGLLSRIFQVSRESSRFLGHCYFTIIAPFRLGLYSLNDRAL